MSSKPQRSLRLEKRSARSLAVLSGAPGEIFFDNDNGTLRVYTDTTGSSIILANRQWVADNTFSGDFNDLTNVPNLATQSYVNAAVAGVPIADLTGLATETYVDTAVSGLAPTTLGDLSDVVFTGSPQVNEVITWNGTEWANSPALVDLTSYYTSAQTDTAISTAISNFQTTIIDAAPAALDTLNELAAALGDDANFASNVTSALSGKEATITAGTTGQYWRGDKSWQTLDATAVGLGNVTNESKATMFTSPTFTGTVTLGTIGSTGTIALKPDSTTEQLYQISATEFYSRRPLRAAALHPSRQGLSQDGTTLAYILSANNGVWAWSSSSFLSAGFTLDIRLLNFNGLNTDRVAEFEIQILQDASPVMLGAVTVDGVPATLLWEGGSAPTPVANCHQIVSIRFGGHPAVIGTNTYVALARAVAYS